MLETMLFRMGGHDRWCGAGHGERKQAEDSRKVFT
jgi:hypothetical protein